MNDERAPEPYLCGDCPCAVKCADDESTFVCAIYCVELECDGNELHCCQECMDRRDEARATAAREWADMADAIAGTMLPDACRQRWIDGAVRYGQEWQSQYRHNVDEAMEELYDAINYFLAAGATGQLSKQHAQRFIEQTVSLLDRLYWVQTQFGRKEASGDVPVSIVHSDG